MWVYSGRRGVHCWVSDKAARQLSGEERRSVVAYLEVIKGGHGVSRKVNLPTKSSLHPSLVYAFSNTINCSRAGVVLEQYFEKTLLKSQNILGDVEQWTKVLELISDKSNSHLHIA